jgi:hypothetical protein
MSIEISVLRGRIENAAEAVGPLWPLRTFNSANPLSGFETLPFHEAVEQAGRLFHGRRYPSPATFRQAWERGDIDADALTETLRRHGISSDPEATLRDMEAPSAEEAGSQPDAGEERLNRLMSKWLAAFFDHGQAPWPMPNRSDGFFAAWRILAPFDRDIPGIRQTSDLPSTKLDAFVEALDGVPESEWETIFTHHLAALPGWVGLIRWQARGTAQEWETAKPITLGGYLAVRLTLARLLDVPLLPASGLANGSPDARRSPEDGAGTTAATHASNGRSATETPEDRPPLPALWLTAWEETFRNQLLTDLQSAGSAESAVAEATDTGERPDAQLVFCIDVRSEIIRRHLEATGAYETHGYAGFFGIPMEHEAYAPGGETGERVKACPPIVDPRHRVAERVADGCEHTAHRYNDWTQLENTRRTLLKTLKNDVAAAFGLVEGSGGFFGAAMALRTLLPDRIFHWIKALEDRVPGPVSFTEMTVDRDDYRDEDGGIPVGLSP